MPSKRHVDVVAKTSNKKAKTQTYDLSTSSSISKGAPPVTRKMTPSSSSSIPLPSSSSTSSSSSASTISTLSNKGKVGKRLSDVSTDDDEEPIDRLAGVYKLEGDFDPYAPCGPCPWGDDTPDLSKQKLDAEERQWMIKQIVQKKQTIVSMGAKYNMKYQKIYGILSKVIRAFNLDIGEGRGRPHLSQVDKEKQAMSFVPDNTCPWGNAEDVDLKDVTLTEYQMDWFVRQINENNISINTLSRRFNISYQKLHSYACKSRIGQPLHQLKGRPRMPDPEVDLPGCPWGKKSPDLHKAKLTPEQKLWLANQVIEGRCNIAYLSRRYHISYQKIKSYCDNKINNRPFRTRKEDPLIPI